MDAPNTTVPNKRQLVRKSDSRVESAHPGAREVKVERALDAFELRKRGWTIRMIADHFDKSPSTIHSDIEQIREGLRGRAEGLCEREREIMAGQCQQIIAKFAPVVLHGDVAIMVDRDGQPVLNGDRIEAISKAAAIIVKAQERIAKLYGLDAPTQIVSEVTNRFANDDDLAARVAEAENDGSPLVAAHSGRLQVYRQRAGLHALPDAEAGAKSA